MSTPGNFVTFGPGANCTIELCPLSDSVYKYRPSLGANAAFIALFGIALAIHTFQGIRWRTWGYWTCMALGCVDEMVGYGGRIMLYQNPFNFSAFIMQIVTITIGPVFFCAAIYIQIATIIKHLGVEHARFPPKYIYYGFISCDVVSLVLQSIGGAMSGHSAGKSDVADIVGLTGLSFQVFTICLFISICVDYAIRYRRASSTSIANPKVVLSRPLKVYMSFLAAATIFILIRCAYRIDELSDGYHGPLIRDQATFITFETVMVLCAVFCLTLSNPGIAFRETSNGAGAVKDIEKGNDDDSSVSESN